MLEREEYEREGFAVRPEATQIEEISVVRRQYLRAREYCGYSLDEIINSRAAQRYLSEIWLLGCMVRKPRKANVLPEKIRLPAAVPTAERRQKAESRKQ